MPRDIRWQMSKNNTVNAKREDQNGMLDNTFNNPSGLEMLEMFVMKKDHFSRLYLRKFGKD